MKKDVVTKDIKIYSDLKREKGTPVIPTCHKAVFFLIPYHKLNGRRRIRLIQEGLVDSTYGEQS